MLIYLPRGPLLQNASHENSIIATLRSHLPLTIVQLNYRLSKDHVYPQPIHDVLAGYDWVKEHLLAKCAISRAGRPQHVGRIGVCGELIGGGLATMLALTECRIGEAGITAAAVSNPVVDWSGVDGEDRGVTVSDTDMAGRLETLRGLLFQKPGHYFDPFASPSLFFRSAGKDVPRANSNAPADDLEHLAFLDREDFFRQQLVLNALSHKYTNAEADDEDLPDEKPRRKTARRYPSASLGLKVPPFHISAGSMPPFEDQAGEFAHLLRKSFLRQAQASNFGRKVLSPAEIAKLDDDERLEQQAQVAKAYSKAQLEEYDGFGLWNDSRHGVKRVQEAAMWLKEKLT